MSKAPLARMLTVALAMVTVMAASARTWRHAARTGLNALIQRAQPGDTIRIKGTVAEGTITLNKRLVLMGEANAVVDGGGRGDVIIVSADSITVKGLTVRGARHSSLEDMAGIKVSNCRGVRIIGNTLDRCFFAIYLNNAHGALLEGNQVNGDVAHPDSMANGIHLWKCDGAAIRGNRVHHHRDGIYLEFVTDSRIEGNRTWSNQRYGLHFMFSHRDAYELNRFEDNGAGVAVMFSKEITMLRNEFRNNLGGSAYGLLLKEINDARIERNVFAGNTVGILVDGCNRAQVQENEFRGNGWAVKLFANSTATVFERNTFAGNTFDMTTNGDLVLSTLQGNYWDRYNGYDLDRDGRGDVPHRPLSIFALVAERMPFAMVLSRSLMVNLLDQSERIVPTLTPAALEDKQPLMKPPHGQDRH